MKIYQQTKKYLKRFVKIFNNSILYIMSKLKPIDYKNLLITFLFGGFVVVSVSLISDYVSNSIAALLWAFPFTIIPTIYYFYLEKKSFSHISDFLWKTIYSIIFLFINILFLYYVYNYSKKILFSLTMVCLFYLIISFIYIKNESKIVSLFY